MDGEELVEIHSPEFEPSVSEYCVSPEHNSELQEVAIALHRAERCSDWAEAKRCAHDMVLCLAEAIKFGNWDLTVEDLFLDG